MARGAGRVRARGARLTLTVLGTGLAVVVATGCRDLSAASRKARPTASRIEVVPMDAAGRPVATVVRPGDTIESVSRQLAGEDWVRWRDALAGRLDPRKLKPGTAFCGWRSNLDLLEEVRVDLDRRHQLVFERDGQTICCQELERPLESHVVRVTGEISSSLFAAIEVAGERPELAVQMAEVYQWDVDFLRDLRVGDSFVAVVDVRTVEGEFFAYGTLYAARFVNRGRVLTAISYPDGEGRVGYYDLEGRPLRKQFLRSPLEFSRITSRFSLRRFHPVLKRHMPHYGVDYGAPIGTPVRVTADGTVTFAGVKGGAGRMVTVRHPNGYETNYLHLSRYGSGVRRGARVDQGQVIGYVGSSGWSTGPHLDYRVKLNGTWVNPLSISSPPTPPLAEERLQGFLAHSLATLELIEGRDPPQGARCEL